MLRLVLIPMLLAGSFACSEYNVAGEPRTPNAPQDELDDALVDDVPGEDDPVDDPDDDPEDAQDDPEVPPIPGEPIADAGPDQLVDPLDFVTIDGIASYDPGGLEPLSYKWTLVDKPVDSTLFLFNRTKRNPKFFADMAGEYTFDLTVQNSAGVWDSSPDRVVIEAKPSQRLYVQLAWDVDSDLDLHMLNAGATIFSSPGDCAYCNMSPEWGTSGAIDNPSLDWDSIDGYGPETTTIESPSTGTYRAFVHYYGQFGDSECEDGYCPTSNATVRIFVDGIEVAMYQNTLNDQGDVWEVASIDWPSAAVTPINTMSSTSLTNCQ